MIPPPAIGPFGARFGLAFHHFGMAVPEPDAVSLCLSVLGYVNGNQAYDPLQKVNLAMRHHADLPDIEIIWPGREPSPIDRIIKRNGGMIYHLCFEVDDGQATADAFEAAGLEVCPVSPPTPAILFGGRHVSFFSLGGLGLIELLERK
jgi:catechol 2,3-dioxygenase-like lactoylglutathione lyase family enzyme